MVATASLSRNPQVIAAEAMGDQVYVNLENWTYLSFDPVGAWLWQQLEQPQSLEALLQSATAHFDGEAALIRADIQEFIADLQRRGFVNAQG